MEINVLKVSVSAGMFLKVSFKELLPGNDERLHQGVSCSAPVHEDLAKAFSLFKPHLALICEQITNEQFIESIPEDYDATIGYSESSEMGEQISKALKKVAKKATSKKNLLGDEPLEDIMDGFTIDTIEHKFAKGVESINLSGSKRLSTLDWMGITTPGVRANGEYPYISDLLQLWESLEYEVREYIINHKYAPPREPELEFPDGQGINEEQY